MKTRQLIAVLAMTAAATTGAAFAQTVSTAGESLTPKTRAEVIAELQQARAQGQLQSEEAGYPVLTNVAVVNSPAASHERLAAGSQKTDRNGGTNSGLYSGA